ncbi:hypothetical protein C8R44DRAFT_826106 [Mycena epipterygia]|nr:hypothetical protein C8R44DRAFT_826106 [Mycena epipterygia]
MDVCMYVCMKSMRCVYKCMRCICMYMDESMNDTCKRWVNEWMYDTRLLLFCSC